LLAVPLAQRPNWTLPRLQRAGLTISYQIRMIRVFLLHST
jgi:hypothetical protein